MDVERRTVLRTLEGPYLLDYAMFTGAMREYVAHALEERFRSDQSDLHRRMFLLAVYREEYSAYEDLGAILDALLNHRQTPEVPILERLISYHPGEVALTKVMERFGITTWQQLHDALKLDRLIPQQWAETFPELDLPKVLRTAAHFFFTDCLRNQKSEGLRAFNKLKHGLLFVPNAQRYLPTLPDAPGAFFETAKSSDEAASNPLTVYAVTMTDEQLENRLRSINFIQANLRLIAILIVIVEHPDVLARCGIPNPLEILHSFQLADLLAFIGQVSSRSEAAASPT